MADFLLYKCSSSVIIVFACAPGPWIDSYKKPSFFIWNLRLSLRELQKWCSYIKNQGQIQEESDDSEVVHNGGASRVVVVDKETNTETTSRSRHRHTVQEQAVRNSAIRRSQTFSPSGKVVPQIYKVWIVLL